MPRFVPGQGAGVKGWRGAESCLPLLGSQREPAGYEPETRVLLARVRGRRGEGSGGRKTRNVKSWGGKVDVRRCSPCSVGGRNASFIRLPKRGCWADLRLVVGLGLPKTKAPPPWCGHTVPQTKFLPGCTFCSSRQSTFWASGASSPAGFGFCKAPEVSLASHGGKSCRARSPVSPVRNDDTQDWADVKSIAVNIV